MHVKQAGVVPEHINISKYVDACRQGRIRSGSFRPGPAAHKPSREGINRLQIVGSPHVTDEEGFPAVAAAGSCRSPPQRPGSPAAQPKPPAGAAPGSAGFAFVAMLRLRPGPLGPGSGKFLETSHTPHFSHTSQFSPMRTPEASSFSLSISYYLQRFRKNRTDRMLMLNDFGKNFREAFRKWPKVNPLCCI